MKKYVIKCDSNYLTTIYQNSLSTSTSINNAMEFDSLENAKAVRNYITTRNENYTYSIIEVETKMTAITD